MDGYIIILLLFAFGFIYYIIDDLRTGECQMIRFIIEMALVYGPLFIMGYLGFIFFPGQAMLIAIMIFIPIIFVLTSGNKIIEFVEKLLPPSYDKMPVDDAIRHLKKTRQAKPEEIAHY